MAMTYPELPNPGAMLVFGIGPAMVTTIIGPLVGELTAGSVLAGECGYRCSSRWLHLPSGSKETPSGWVPMQLARLRQTR